MMTWRCFNWNICGKICVVHVRDDHRTTGPQDHTVTRNSYETYTAWRGRWQPGWAGATWWSPPSSSSSSSSTRLSHGSGSLQHWNYCKYFHTALAGLNCLVFIYFAAVETPALLTTVVILRWEVCLVQTGLCSLPLFTAVVLTCSVCL